MDRQIGRQTEQIGTHIDKGGQTDRQVIIYHNKHVLVCLQRHGEAVSRNAL